MSERDDEMITDEIKNAAEEYVELQYEHVEMRSAYKDGFMDGHSYAMSQPVGSDDEEFEKWLNDNLGLKTSKIEFAQMAWSACTSLKNSRMKQLEDELSIAKGKWKAYAEVSEKLCKELAQHRFNNDNALSIDQTVADRIKQLEEGSKRSLDLLHRAEKRYIDLQVIIGKKQDEIDKLQRERNEAVEAVKFYADGAKDDLEPKPEKKHLYDEDYLMSHPRWIQRSMSDYVGGKRARGFLSRLERKV